MPEHKCDLCNFSTPIKTHLTRHLLSEKHLLRTNTSAASKIMDLKAQQEELKAKMKQDIKTMGKEEEDWVSYGMVERAIHLWDFMEEITNHMELEDFDKIVAGQTTYEDILIRDIAIEHEKHKSLVIDKNIKHSGIWKNKSGAILFDTRDTFGTGLTALYKLIPLYHAHLKELARQSHKNTDTFVLTEDQIESIKKNIKELITVPVLYEQKCR
jgi:hypothetical protein